MKKHMKLKDKITTKGNLVKNKHILNKRQKEKEKNMKDDDDEDI